MQIKKILVPVDFSKCSINALKIAIQIAKAQEASIEVVNAIHVPAYPHADVIAAENIVQPLLSDYEDQVQEQFDALPNELPELNDLTFTTRKFVSQTKDAIYTCIEKDDVDLIIMGTKGSHSKLEKLLGSVSSDVIKFSTVPVLVIPENISSFNISRIGFAADLNKIGNMKKLDMLTWFAKMTDAHINIFHISADRDEESLIENAREKMNLLTSLSEIEHSYAWIKNDEPLEGILDFIESHQLDMLVMYPRQHGFWDRMFHGSMTKKVAVQIEIPLLTIHE